MEDIVAIKVTVWKRGKLYILTWGRIFDRIDDRELLACVKTWLEARGLTISKIELCESLASASGETYFYESFFKMSQKPIPYGPRYAAWQRDMRKKIRSGDELYLVTPIKANRPTTKSPPSARRLSPPARNRL